MQTANNNYDMIYAKLKHYELKENDINKLIDMYIDSNFNNNVLYIITNQNILETRNISQIEAYIRILKENLYRFSVTEVIIDKFVLENRNFYEQIALINFLKTSNYDNEVRNMITDEEILQNTAFVEQYEMIKKYIADCKKMSLKRNNA